MCPVESRFNSKLLMISIAFSRYGPRTTGSFTNYVNKILGVFDPYPLPGCSHLLLNVNIFLKFLTPTLPLTAHVVCE